MKKSFLSLISVALVYVFSATVVSCSNYESPLTGQKYSAQLLCRVAIMKAL